jgi:uncharacterized protein (UPF0303 family)
VRVLQHGQHRFAHAATATERRLASFTCDDAWTLGQYAREAYERHSAGAARRVGVAIQIHSFDGQVLFACVVGQGATPRLGEMIRRKIETGAPLLRARRAVRARAD